MAGTTTVYNESAALIEGKTNGIKVFRYPEDLGVSPDLKHVMQFKIVRPKGTSLDTDKNMQNSFDFSNATDLNNLTTSQNTVTQDILNAEFGEALSGVVNNARNLGGPAKSALLGAVNDVVRILTPGAINDAAKSNLNRFNTTRATLGLLGQEENDVAVIQLYVPDNITYSYGATWDSASFANVTMSLALARLLLDNNTNDTTRAETLRAGLRPTVANLAQVPIDMVTSLTGDQTPVGGTTGTVGDLMALQRRQVNNPLTEFLFRGVDHRSFVYSFTFQPRSRAETLEVKKIIEQFLMSMQPELSGGARFLSFPDEFEITFLYQGIENEWLRKIQRVVLTNVKINDTPSGLIMHNDGSPAKIELELSFQEVVQMNRQLVKAGY